MPRGPLERQRDRGGQPMGTGSEPNVALRSTARSYWSVPCAPSSGQQSSHTIETVDAAVGHQRKRRTPAKQFVTVGHAHPPIGERRLWIENLQIFVDAHDER